jgi:hypothetical protein
MRPKFHKSRTIRSRVSARSRLSDPSGIFMLSDNREKSAYYNGNPNVSCVATMLKAVPASGSRSPLGALEPPISSDTVATRHSITGESDVS